ncbi:MAG: UDP-N-acetylglucosamine--N-acetylmuramyl-(pentapeptide) pyrophosphoryl-undecaprenol N-acetylglucosamine transferase [Phycisphaerae bacterium]
MSPSGRPIFIFAGGGSGGHLCPGIAVADALKRRRPDAQVVFACSNRTIDRKLLKPLGYALVPQPVRPLPRGPRGWWRFMRAWVRSSLLARRMIADLRPSAVLGLGGFAAGPMVKCSGKKHLPTALLNPDAVPGIANRHLAAFSDVVFTQFTRAAERFPPKLRDRVRLVGCPVRRGFFEATRERGVGHLGLDADKKTLLVFGGSLLASAVTDAAAAVAGDLEPLAEGWQVLHITADEKTDAVREAHEGGRLSVKVMGYCERMDLAMAAADLALCRAGASTMAELAATGTPAVLMPYPHHRDRHQYLNAADAVEAGATVIVDDTDDASANADALRRELLPVMRDDARLGAMRQAAERLSATDAADAVAAWLLEAAS